jgi:hypothetical protein
MLVPSQLAIYFVGYIMKRCSLYTHNQSMCISYFVQFQICAQLIQVFSNGFSECTHLQDKHDSFQDTSIWTLQYPTPAQTQVGLSSIL